MNYLLFYFIFSTFCIVLLAYDFITYRPDSFLDRQFEDVNVNVGDFERVN